MILTEDYLGGDRKVQRPKSYPKQSEVKFEFGSK